MNRLRYALALFTLLSTPALAQGASPPAAAHRSAVASEPTTEEARALEARIRAAFERGRLATIALVLFDPELGRIDQSCAATIVSPDGYAVTAAHCLGEPGDTLEVELHDGRRIQALTLGQDVSRDFGLIKLTPLADEPFPYVAIQPRVRDLVRDEVVVMIGFPGHSEKGRGPVLRMGTYVGERTDGLLCTSCTMMPGDSGGPLLDLEGRLVGINSEIETPLDRNYHVPMSEVIADWAGLLASEFLGDYDAWEWESEDQEEAHDDVDSDGSSELGQSGGDLGDDEGDWDWGSDFADDEPWFGGVWPADEIVAPEDPGDVHRERRVAGGRAALASAFGPHADVVARSVVQVESRARGRRQRCLGVVAGDGTLVVSKSSRVGERRVRAQLSDGTSVTLEPVRRDRANDLVLLRMLEGRGTPAEWCAEVAPPVTGALVAAPGVPTDKAVLGVGVVSTRLHGTERLWHGDLGVRTRTTQDGDVKVILVEREGAAKRAGIATRDRIERIDAREIRSGTDLDAALALTDPGDEVSVVVRRGEERHTFAVVLDSNAVAYDDGMFVHVADLATVSVRRGGFPRVLRHDVPLTAEQCGGPLIDLAGRVIGLNIARPDRVGTLALPADVVLGFLAEER